MKERLISGLFIVAPTVILLLYAPSIVLLACALIVSTVGILEFYKMLDQSRIPAFKLVGATCGCILLIATYFGMNHDPASDWQGFVLAGTVIFLMVRQFPQKNNEWPFPTMACTLMGVLYVPFLLSFFIKLSMEWSNVTWRTPLLGQTGCYLVFYVVSVVKMTDSGALMIGKAFGRHKLFPRVSPGKTWVGCFGGLLTGVAVSYLFIYFTGWKFGSLEIGPMHAVLLGVLLSAAGMVGDLAESLLKRASGVKDSGRLAPGIGGILDIFDSLLFAVPIFYAYLKLAL